MKREREFPFSGAGQSMTVCVQGKKARANAARARVCRCRVVPVYGQFLRNLQPTLCFSAALPLFHPPSPLSYAARHRPATFRVDTDDWNKVYQTEGSCMDKYAVAYDRYVDEDTSCTVMLRQRTKERRENTEVQTTHRTLRRTSVTSSFPPSL